MRKYPKKIKSNGDEIAKAINSRGFVNPEEIHRITELEECLLAVLREVDIVRSSDYNNSVNQSGNEGQFNWLNPHFESPTFP